LRKKGRKDASLYQGSQRSLPGSSRAQEPPAATVQRITTRRRGTNAPAAYEQDEANNDLDCVTSARDERLRTATLEQSFYTTEYDSSMGLEVGSTSTAQRSQFQKLHSCLT